MTETTEPTREWIEKCIRELESALAGHRPSAHVSQMEKDLGAYRMALRTLDAEAQLSEMKRERAEKAERQRDEARAEVATLRAIYAKADAETVELRAEVARLREAMPSEDTAMLIDAAIDPDEPRLSGACRAQVRVWLARLDAAKGVR